MWTNISLSEAMIRTILRYRTGTLYNNKLGKRFGYSQNSLCNHCKKEDSAGHILGECPNNKNLAINRHNIAARYILSSITKGHKGNYVAYTDIGKQENMEGLEETTNNFPTWILPRDTPEDTLITKPDIILIEGMDSAKATTMSKLNRPF